MKPVTQASRPRSSIVLVLAVVLLSLVPGITTAHNLSFSGQQASLAQQQVGIPFVLQQPTAQTVVPLEARELLGPLLLLAVLAWVLRQKLVRPWAHDAALVPAVSSPHLVYLTHQLQLEGG